MNALTVAGISHMKNILLDKQTGETTLEGQAEVISRLKFIGCIEKDEKVDTRNVNRQPNTFATKMYRTFLYRDSRVNTLKFIKDVISRTFEIIQLNIHQKNYGICQNIILDLIKAKQGILNLKHTYSDDTKFCCDMDVFIENVDTRIANLKENFPSIFESESHNVT